MAGSALRLFVAVDVPADVRAGVDTATNPLRSRAPELRWTDPQGWHLTVAFLGATAAERLQPVLCALGKVAAGTSPVPLQLTGRAGTFGSGVLWAGLEPHPELAALATGVQAALAPLGYQPPDRPYRAHLTLARGPRGGRRLRPLADLYGGPAARWTALRLVLLQSVTVPGRRGPRYAQVDAWPLTANAQGRTSV